MENRQPIPKFQLTVDVVLFTLDDDGLNLLLIKRAGEPFKDSWALPGGFLQANETSGAAAMRILHDKAGVGEVYIEQLYTFDDPSRDVRGHFPSITYFALVPREQLKIISGGQTQHPTLHAIKKLPELAFDHSIIVDYALHRLRAKLEYTNIVFSLLPEHFTFNQLQKAYESVLDRPLDKRNFRKKFISLGLIEETDKVLEGGRHRPARLYRFSSRKPIELERWF